MTDGTETGVFGYGLACRAGGAFRRVCGASILFVGWFGFRSFRRRLCYRSFHVSVTKLAQV